MRIAPSTHLTTRIHNESSPWEMALRYGAATAATLLAIAGAQLIVPNSFALMLVVLTLAGVPVSLYLRLNDMRIGALRLSRPLWNSVTVLSTFGASAYFVLWSKRDFLMPLISGQASTSFLENFGANEPVTLLMQMFLLFAAFRSFSLISDKDATLTAVPSFSVLLLLIPMHRQIEVVLYFVAWIFVAATLFALDHRSEVRASVVATVPAIVPGQDVRLGARALSVVLGISLLAAVGISLVLTARDPSERSSAETAITSLATRLTQKLLAMPEAAINSGPERQIDFTAGPPLPSREVLWQVAARSYGGKPIYPSYWRLFALGLYNGRGWTQGREQTVAVPRTNLNFKRWPPVYNFYPNQYRGKVSPNDQFFGYDVARSAPQFSRQFGRPAALVRHTLRANVSNLGFIPIQPGLRALVLPESEQKEVRVRRDGAIDVGVLQEGQIVRMLSDVPALPEYGVLRGNVPLKRLSATQIAASQIELSSEERAGYLQLPDTLPARVRDLGRDFLKNAARDGSNYARAQQLALSIQSDAVYTLRPPTAPTGRDATDFFLFEGARRGYCTYFAGALTVLCRTQGIPARVVSGFAGVEWNGDERGVLRDANAHAWTEVWVDGFGWAIVDATPAQDRGDNAPNWAENWADLFSSTVGNAKLWASGRITFLIFATGAVFLLFLALQARAKNFGFHFSRRAKNDDFERRAIGEIYRRTARVMERKFRPKSHWETPDEWLQFCAAALSRSDAEELRRLTALYLAACYAKRPLPAGSANLARESAARIRWKILRS